MDASLMQHYENRCFGQSLKGIGRLFISLEKVINRQVAESLIFFFLAATQSVISDEISVEEEEVFHLEVIWAYPEV